MEYPRFILHPLDQELWQNIGDDGTYETLDGIYRKNYGALTHERFNARKLTDAGPITADNAQPLS